MEPQRTYSEYVQGEWDGSPATLVSYTIKTQIIWPTKKEIDQKLSTSKLPYERKHPDGISTKNEATIKEKCM